MHVHYMVATHHRPAQLFRLVTQPLTTDSSVWLHLEADERRSADVTGLPDIGLIAPVPPLYSGSNWWARPTAVADQVDSRSDYVAYRRFNRKFNPNTDSAVPDELDARHA